MNPWLILAAVIAWGGAYFWGRNDGADLVRAEQSRAEHLVLKVREEAQLGAAAEIAKLEIKHVTLTQHLQKETRIEPVYLDCRHTPDGLRVLNAALTNRPVTAGDRQLPGDAGRTPE